MKALFSILFGVVVLSANAQSAVRECNSLLLGAISKDFARPTVHARNLYQSSMMMYDIWAAYDPSQEKYFLGKTLNGFACPFDGLPIPQQNLQQAREEAISFAMYRFISHRFMNSPGVQITTNNINNYMASKGYNVANTSTNYVGGGPAEFGNYVAQMVLLYGQQDGANEAGNYSNLYYQPVNPPVEPENPGNPNMIDPNRWQTVSLSVAIDQAGNPLFSDPPFLGAEWGNVKPFSLNDSLKSTFFRNGNAYNVYLDPGPPVYIDTLDTAGITSLYKWNFLLVPVWQSHLDPEDGVMWDVSPGAIGNIQNYPATHADLPNFYNLLDGDVSPPGHSINPKTGQPYAPQIVPRGDYTRVLAEFWADGPASVTPPGHWFEILHTIQDHPDFERKWKGQGPELDPLEYDAKSHFALGGAMHDAAITAWGIKGWYDYLRPVSAVRFMAEKGQCSNPNGANYHPAGLPLIPGYIEQVAIGDSLAGANNEHVGKVKLYTWKGPEYINDPETDMAGVGWILAENWWPYQRPTFVTPPFAGYISGHSTFSRTAAELLTEMTGDPYFPGGMSNFLAEENDFLVFEEGPSVDVTLQWATYRDASDQCSLSRIWGGIHPPVDDIPGRQIGMVLGPMAFNHADSYIQISRPKVVNVTCSDTVISIADIGTQFSVDIQYNVPMNTAVNPQIDFVINSPLSGQISLQNQVWTNNQTFHVVFNVENFSSTLDEVYLRTQNAIDLNGTVQNVNLWVNPFRIDTKRPEVLSITVSETVVNDASVNNGFFVTLVTDEPCESTAIPQVSFATTADLSTTLIPDLPNSQWISSTQFVMAFEVIDNTLSVQNIGIEISGFTDLAGNQQLPLSQSGVFSIEHQNPGIVSVTVNDPVLNLQDLGSQALIVNMIFNKPMNTQNPPSFTFPVQNPLGTSLSLNAANTVWLSDTSCKITYNLLNANEEFFNVTAGLLLLKDPSGNSPEPGVLNNLFTIDTKRPSVIGETVNTTVISDSNIGTAGFEVQIDFSENMDVTQKPVVQILGNPSVSGSLSYSISNSTWESPVLYSAKFNVNDQNIEVENLSLSVSFARDASGNNQTAYTKEELLDLDTKNPSLSVVTANTYNITDATGQFIVVSVFSEPMKTDVFPVFEFSADSDISGALLLNTSLSEWLNSSTLKAVFDVGSLNIAEDEVSMSILDAFDLAGNPNVPAEYPQFLSLNITDTYVSDSEFSDTEIRLFPNPVSSGSVVNLFVSNELNLLDIGLYSLTGAWIHVANKPILSAGTHSISLPPIAAGIYILYLQSDSGTKRFKLIISD